MIRGRPFEAGNKLSRGRPPGSRNKRGGRGQQLLDQYSEVLIQKALALAIQGDATLLRIFLPYLLRSPSDRLIQIGPLAIGSLEELSKSSEKVLHKVASGKLSLGEARQVSDLFEDRRHILETQELDKRVRVLEQFPEAGGSE